MLLWIGTEVLVGEGNGLQGVLVHEGSKGKSELVHPNSLHMYSSNKGLSRLGLHVSIAHNSYTKGSITLELAYTHEFVQLGLY